MAFEEFRVQIAMLMDEIARNPADAHELQVTLRERLLEMQALGLPLPEDLVDLEEYLEQDLEEPPLTEADIAEGTVAPEEPKSE